MKTLLSKEDLHDGVMRMADKITACYEDRQLTIVGVLTGSVVLMDVPPHTTVAGVPAVIVGVPEEEAPSRNMDHALLAELRLQAAAHASK